MLDSPNTCRPGPGLDRFELHQLLRLNHGTRQLVQVHLSCFVITGSPGCLEPLQVLAGTAALELVASVLCLVLTCILLKFFAYARCSVRRRHHAI